MKLKFNNIIITMLLCLVGQFASAQESNWVGVTPVAQGSYYLFNKGANSFIVINENGAPENSATPMLFTLTEGPDATDLQYTVDGTNYYLYQSAGVYGYCQNGNATVQQGRSTESMKSYGNNYRWKIRSYNGGYQIYSNHKYSTAFMQGLAHRGDTDRYITYTGTGYSCSKQSNEYNTDNGTWLFIPVSNATMSVSATAKYGTFCAPFAVTIPAGVTAYTVDGVNGNALVMNEVTTTIPAKTPVVLNAEDGLAATSFFGLAVEGTPAVGLLTGVYTATPAPVGSYVLQNNDSKLGFYKVAEGKQPTVGANRAYLTVPSNAPAFFFDTETAIEAVEALTQGEAAIYDINGMKQQSLQKGINIVKMANGKTQKVLVK